MIYNQIKQYQQQTKKCSKDNVCFYNFWEQPTEEIWFYSFLKSRGLLEKKRRKYHFFSCLGNKRNYDIDKFLHPFNVIRLFFSGENLHRDDYKIFEDYYLNDGVDIALGFDVVDDKRYMRFPIWICEIIPPSANEIQIRQICENLSYQKYEQKRTKFCAMVASGDISQIVNNKSLQYRKTIVDGLNNVGQVDCAGKFLNNNSELKDKYKDDKLEFLKQYKFFVCPENTNYQGYVTEKPFHCIQSGCVPIYDGSCNNPEPDVLNKDAILFWNDNTVNQVKCLLDSEVLYKEFYEQPRLQTTACEYVVNVLSELESRIRMIQ